jgi:hypothetical protein
LQIRDCNSRRASERRGLALAVSSGVPGHASGGARRSEGLTSYSKLRTRQEYDA